MVLNDLGQLHGGYRHVYLAPHLDDAALSCGGMIAQQAEAGEPVLVVTLCTAAPPGGPYSPLAEEFHREWRLTPAAVMATRQAEERAALDTLGADGFWADLLDAIYRYPAAYHSRAALFGQPAADDPLLPAARELVASLRERLPEARFYAPLGVGSHVDHLITRRAALERGGPALGLYEDFPYAAREGALERQLAALGGGLQARATPIAAALARKVAAIHAYASQLPELASSQLGRPAPDGEAPAIFAAVVADYARQVGGERVWYLPERSSASTVLPEI